MKKFWNILAKVVLILGIIGSIAIAYFLGNDWEGRNWVLTIVYFLSGLIATGIEAAFFYTLYMILDKLEFLENESGGWICLKCGTENGVYDSRCTCGAKRPDNGTKLFGH